MWLAALARGRNYRYPPSDLSLDSMSLEGVLICLAEEGPLPVFLVDFRMEGVAGCILLRTHITS